MIVFAALIPTSPLLVKRNGKTAEKTLAAISDIERAIDQQKPDTLLIISQDAQMFAHTYTLPYAERFNESLKRLGFISEHLNYSADIELLAKLHTYARQHKIALRSVHNDLLDKDSGLALRLLGAQKKKYSIMTLGTCDLSIGDHIEVGQKLKEVLQSTTRRVGVIMTGQVGSETVARGVIASLANRSASALAQVCENNAQIHGTLCRPLAVGYGLLYDFPAQTDILCDEIFSDHSLISAILFSD